MAINKNFVIKNGIEVNDNVFVVDPDINKVGINTALPDHTFHVIGGIGVTDATISGVTTALGDILVADSNGEDGKAFAVRVSAGNSVGINTANPRYPLEIIGPAQSGTIAEYVFGDLEITGDINSANFNSGSASFSGITTFTNGTDNTLGNADTGAVQIDGGLGVNKNVTIGAGLSVTGTSYFVGEVTFAGGTNGDNINLGSTDADNIVFNADVNSNIIPNATSSFDLGSSSKEWRDLHLAGNAGIGSLSVTGISTFSDNVRILGNQLLIDTGSIVVQTGNLDVAGVSTFGNNVEISSLTENRIPIVGAGSTIEDDANLTFDGNTLVVGAALTVTGISTFNNNVSIASLTNNRIPIVGAGSTIEDDVNLTFDGTTLSVGAGVTIVGVSTFNSNVEITSLTDNRIPIVGAGSTIEDDANLTFDGSTLAVGVDLDVDGHTELDDLKVTGVATFTNNVNISGNLLYIDTGNIVVQTGHLDVAGVSTFGSNIDANGDLDVDGDVRITGVTTFTDTTENTLGDANTGSVQLDGGLGVAKNVTVGGGLSVTGNSYFVGMVTFAAGSGGDIILGDGNTDKLVLNARVDSNLIPDDDNTFDLGAINKQWKDLYVNGLADLDYVNVSAAATFAGRIVGAATSNVIPFLYSNFSDLPDAGTYHGAFAHVHSEGKAYFAHAGNWLELVNTNTASVVGTGTEGYNVGVVTATQADIGTGGLDVDGHTELDGVNVSGATTTNILHVGTAGTVLSVNDETSEFKIGSATNPVTATMNGGAIPSIGLVIALGG